MSDIAEHVDVPLEGNPRLHLLPGKSVVEFQDPKGNFENREDPAYFDQSKNAVMSEKLHDELFLPSQTAKFGVSLWMPLRLKSTFQFD